MPFIVCNKHCFSRIESDSIPSSSFDGVPQTIKGDDIVRVFLSGKLGPFPTLIKTLDSEPSGLVIPLSGLYDLSLARLKYRCLYDPGSDFFASPSYRSWEPGSYIFRTAFSFGQIFTGSFVETDRIKISVLKTYDSATYDHHMIFVPLSTLMEENKGPIFSKCQS